MKIRIVFGLTAMIISTGILLSSCQSNEFTKSDSTVGLNGGFEVTDSGYPVNWAFFPKPGSGDHIEVSIDTTHVVEGANSLKLVTYQSDKLPGFRSLRIPVESGKSYKISMWIKNEGCHLKVNRIVQNVSGTKNIRSDVIVNSSASSAHWQKFEEILSISDKEAFVFLKFLVDGSGTIWCDDITIEEIAE